MLSRFSVRRLAISSFSFAEKLSYFRDASFSNSFISRCSISTAGSESVSARSYADFAIFKGKAALMMYPLPARFTNMESGNLRVHRKGVVLLKFIPAIGQRKYDSEKKQYFALSATEVGCLISLAPTESCEFFHDPSMKSSLEGQVKKTMSISAMADTNGYLFNLSVLNVPQKTSQRFTVPVTKAEFAVMRTACTFALPHILGWDRLMGPYLLQTERGLPKQMALNLDPDLEWER